MKRKFLSIILFLGVVIPGMAQYYHTQFGHNRIQYRRYDWYYYSTNNFEVYYYSGGHEYATEALSFLEKDFTELTDILGYAPYTKTKLFIYNSVQELQQSNIGIGGDVYTIGGKTDFVKLQVEMAYPGQASEFRQEITYHMGRILINDMMFGGSLAEIFQNSYLLSLPEWFIGGAAKYLAYGWSQEMDDQVRDYLGRKSVNKLVKIQEDEAEMIGQSIWNYIAIKYGRSNISNILNLTRIIRNEENSISSTLGISFKDFLADWENYYHRQKEEIAQNYIAPNKENVVANYQNKEVTMSHVKMSPDGKKVAYTYHKDGKYQVKVVDLTNSRVHNVVKGGYLINQQQTDDHLPLIDWQDDETLGVLLYKRGDLYLNTYNLSTNERLHKPLTRFRQVEGFSFNDNGRLAIISGDVDGQNDLFLISMRRNALKRITNDQYDDIDPVFIPGTAALIFSSNRVNDSVRVKDVKLETIDNNYNLFLYNLDTTTVNFMRLTNTYSVDRKPVPKNAYEVYYLSDQKGITNLYKYDFTDSTFVQVSNFQYSISDFDIAVGEDENLTFLMLDQGKPKVFVDPTFNFEKRIFTPQTARQRMVQAKFLANRFTNNRKKAEPKVEEVKVDTLPPGKSIVDSLLLPDSFFFDDADARPPGVKQTRDDDLIDTDNYVFEDEVKPTFRPESFFSNYRKFEKESRVIGPRQYEPRFSFSNVVTSFAINPLRGFSLLMETQISDLLENHRLNGGVQTTTDLKSGRIYTEYQFLKYWMDIYVRYDRNSYFFSGLNPNNRLFLGKDIAQDLAQRYTSNKLEISAALPLTNAFRLELSPFYTNTQFNNLQWEYVSNISSSTSVLAPNSRTNYGGVRAAMIIDNTVEKGFNSFQGTRGSIEYENYVGLGNAKKSFSRINVDLRHYQKIHKEFTLAGRLFYGRSMGNNKQNYLLGGMQNWMFRQFVNQGADDPLKIDNSYDNSNLLFTKFVTNLRGFDYNEIYGNNVLSFNAELRLPVFRYFSNAPISSTFLRNFEMIGFYDIGTAWTGKAPFTKAGAAFTKKYQVENSPFSAQIASFQNPWLASYGWGVRTVILGYYLKVDVAHPIKDYHVGNTRVYLTLGLDF